MIMNLLLLLTLSKEVKSKVEKEGGGMFLFRTAGIFRCSVLMCWGVCVRLKLCVSGNHTHRILNSYSGICFSVLIRVFSSRIALFPLFEWPTFFVYVYVFVFSSVQSSNSFRS